jgi:hypothetical protein
VGGRLTEGSFSDTPPQAPAASLAASASFRPSVPSRPLFYTDDPRSPRYIETITKRGYRLVAPITAGEARMNAVPNRPPALRRGLQFAASILAAMASGISNR